MINIKTRDEIEIMRECGKISSGALKVVLENVKAGVKLKDLDRLAEEYIVNKNAKPSFKTVDGYNFTTCTNVNAGIVHGVPNEYVLKSGDILSVDLGAYYKGFHTDMAYTIEVETNNETELLRIGKLALEKAISVSKVGNRVGDISNAIQSTVENAGYTASEILVGHGIGRNLHEDPHIPCVGKPKTGPKIKQGMVFAIEVIYQKGQPELIESRDGWTLETFDNSLSSLFEKTIAVTKRDPIVLTEYLIA